MEKRFVLVKTEITDSRFYGNEVVMTSANIKECERALLDVQKKTIAEAVDWYKIECGENINEQNLSEYISVINKGNGYITQTEIVLKKEKLLCAYYYSVLEVD